MKLINTIILSALFLTPLSLSAQVESGGSVVKKTSKEKEASPAAPASQRRASSLETQGAHDADLEYSKQIYRRLDLEKTPNAALSYPEEAVNGQENFFCLLLKNVLDGKIPAYEYLDGKEIFTDQYRVKIPDLVSRFDIIAVPAKGSTESNPRYQIEDIDIPSSQIGNYYVIENWEFDRRSSAMKNKVVAICPVMNNYSDYGAEGRYPMFWVKYEDIRPYLLNTYVYVDDDNNLPRYTLDDYFTLNLYDGEIYKTGNLRNMTLAQIYPNENDLRHAQDSIENRLHSYGKDLWVPSREEYLAQKNRVAESSDSTIVAAKDENIMEKAAASSRAKKKSTKKSKKLQSSSSNATAEKSVRRRKR